MISRPNSYAAPCFAALVSWISLALLAFSACAGEGPPTADPVRPVAPVALVELVPEEAELIVGASLRLLALPTDEQGEDLLGRGIIWSVSDESVARVDDGGLVEGLEPGLTLVTATIEDVSARASLRVVPAPASRVVVLPAALELELNGTATLEGSVFNVWGAAIPDAVIAWESSEPDIVAIDEAGRIQALAVGSAVVTASTDGVRGIASVMVLATPIAEVLAEEEIELHAGRAVQLSAAAVDAEGEPISDVPIYWSSTDPQVASVDTHGLLRAWSPGETIVSAHAGGRSAEISVRVHPMTVLRIELEPIEARAFVGEEVRFSALVFGVDEEPLHGRPIAWGSSDEGLATVDSAGVVQALAPGVVSIRAAAGGAEAAAILTLEQPPKPVDSISLQPSILSLYPGQRKFLEATLLDASGEPVVPAAIEWRTSDEEVATVDSNGEVLGIGQGRASISAHADGLSAAAAVWVTSISRLEISPLPDELFAGERVALDARAYDAGGAAVSMPIRWTSSDESVLATLEDREIEGRSPGKATLRASILDKVEEWEFTIRELRLQEVAVGGDRVCGLDEGGLILCWDQGTASGRGFPTRVDAGVAFESLTLGRGFICGLTSEGRALCMGLGLEGQLGDGQLGNRNTFEEVAGGHRFRQIDASYRHVCGVTLSGEGLCWGTSYALGMGEIETFPSTPSPVLGGLVFESIRVSPPHPGLNSGHVSCGITTDRRGYCWGVNTKGETGTGTTELVMVPTELSGARSFTMIAASSRTEFRGNPWEPDFYWGSTGHGCGVTTEGEGFCWGSNQAGELGNGSFIPSLVPTPIAGGKHFVSIESQAGDGAAFSCGIDTSKRGLCWGDNRYFQLGDGTNLSSSAPTQIVGGLELQAIKLGDRFACALAVDGLAYCWGTNPNGLWSGLGWQPVPTLLSGQRWSREE